MAAPTNAYVIHLRGDRRRDRNVSALTAMLRESGIPHVEVVPGVRPADQGPMFSRGEWGCYLSHVECLRRAAERSPDEMTFILEDDVLLVAPLERLTRSYDVAAARPWDFLHLGHAHNTVFRDWDPRVMAADLLPVRGVLYGMFGYCVRSTRLPECIEFLERLPHRDPLDGGGVGIDGAYCEMTWADPTLVRLAVPRSLFQPVPGIKSTLRSTSASGRLRAVAVTTAVAARDRIRDLRKPH
jgi:hypothetical protein